LAGTKHQHWWPGLYVIKTDGERKGQDPKKELEAYMQMLTVKLQWKKIALGGGKGGQARGRGKKKLFKTHDARGAWEKASGPKQKRDGSNKQKARSGAGWLYTQTT